VSDKIEKNEMGGAVAQMGEEKGMYRVSVGKTKAKRSLGRPRCKWEDHIEMDL
jgi:hypothetical protein